ncbi:Stp1/IreP family PP2C-type Ser/Thr phosphatase [Caproiciproducens sp. MSJ-32]|uniref:Stp1/IreP family PP2C-type Ser/Thr phosphatase n=1 Tax=Caproiciproducens sp. MSJ-32 TaxID=2841527 RepID=UPI001C10FE0D|nr:Stp1/IreP family PP2C-type Ser/Thr phosphatase [Caproiciproducens sp. MSJ-32]MBU5454021.1 Stp1/IreP family PP2C-type Ser/Thr phosphatase [Caproiciproducens sp. MSJ-32]
MVGVKTDLGNIRSLNEDYFEFYESDNYKIYVVADGMGGHNAGEVASKTAARALVEYIKNNYQDEENKELLKAAIEYANKQVYELANEDETYNGMGTTIVACYITRDFIQIANVGDSACFGVKDKEIIKITKDHSLVQELLDAGSISKEEAENHPNKNIITRAIGTYKNVEIDIFDIDKSQYNLFILCTDGLTNEVSLEEISNEIVQDRDLQNICENLVGLAKKNGGRDNITVMLVGGEV